MVFSHGGPYSAVGYGFNFKQQYFAANGYFVFDTNFRSSTGYGDDFKWATWGAWGTKDGQDVISGVDSLEELSGRSEARCQIGHSYGGFMTNWLITAYPDRFAAAAAGAGISNWASDYATADIYRTKETEFFGTPWQEDALARMNAQSPLMRAGPVKTPTLFIHGEEDQRVPYTEAEQLYFAIRRAAYRQRWSNTKAWATASTDTGTTCTVCSMSWPGGRRTRRAARARGPPHRETGCQGAKGPSVPSA